MQIKNLLKLQKKKPGTWATFLSSTVMVLLIEGNSVFKGVKTLLRKGDAGVYFCSRDKRNPLWEKVTVRSKDRTDSLPRGWVSIV